MKVSGLIAIALALSGASVALGANAPGLMETDKAFSDRAQTAGLAAAFEEYAAPDAEILRESLWEPITGPEAIGESFAGAGEGVSLVWEPARAEVSESGDLGFTWGRWTLSMPQADDDPRIVRGKYISVWRRQLDGEWKYVLDGGHTTTASPPE